MNKWGAVLFISMFTSQILVFTFVTALIWPTQEFVKVTDNDLTLQTETKEWLN